MITAIQPERVVVRRHGAPPEYGRTVHQVHLEERNQAGDVIGRGEFLGYGVELEEKRQVVYAQASQIAPA